MKTKERRLIYSQFVSGHYVEYLHHLYMGALADTENEYVFAVPRAFEEKRSLLEWPKSSHISFLLFDGKITHSHFLLVNAWSECQQLKKIILNTQSSWVLLISLIDFIPFISLLAPKDVKISGILYRLYQYVWPELTIIQRIQDWLKFWTISRTQCIKKAFVLNDSEQADSLNNDWCTSKFTYLPDPYVPFDENVLRDMRSELGITADETMVLHLGSITHGKGSDRIFDMIDRSSEADLKNYCFVFAGVIAENIKAAFYERYHECKKKAHVILKEGFLSYEDMGSLVRTADKVVLPYRRVAQSSGIIAYCAQLGTPVYVPNKGLIGKLVKKYHIGLTVDKFDDIHSLEKEYECSWGYCESHTTGMFVQVLLNN